MSGYEQGGEDSSAGAAAAPVPTAGEEQQSKRHALEKELCEVKAKIKEVETEIAADKTKADNINIEAERVALRNTIAANTERVRSFEQDVRKLREKIEQLSAPAEQSTAAGGRSHTLCLPLSSLIGLSRRVLRASPAHLHPCTPLLPWCTSTPSRIIHRHLCSCVALPLCIAASCRPHSPQVVPCYAAARANRDITVPSPCGLRVVSGARSEYH
jgi:hypothetical protein